MSACINCNRPCIMDTDGNCRIAKVRTVLNISFKDAWELLTQCNFGEPNIPAYVEPHVYKAYKEWIKAGEPLPQDYQV